MRLNIEWFWDVSLRTEQTLNACITRADDQLSKPITLQTKNAECNKHRVDAIVVRAYFRLG